MSANMVEIGHAVAASVAGMALRQLLRDAVAEDAQVVALRVDVEADAADVMLVYVNAAGEFIGGGSL